MGGAIFLRRRLRIDAGRGRRGNDSHNIRATFGDGSATLSIRTFSGDVVIARR